MYGSINASNKPTRDTLDAANEAPRGRHVVPPVLLFKIFFGVVFVVAILGMVSFGTRKSTDLASTKLGDDSVIDFTKLSKLGSPPAAAAASSSISKRGQTIKSVRDDLEMFLKGASDPYHPIH